MSELIRLIVFLIFLPDKAQQRSFWLYPARQVYVVYIVRPNVVIRLSSEFD